MNRNPKLENLKHFTSEYQPNNKGRKKSKLKAFIEHNDLSSADIKGLAKMVLDKTEAELKLMMDDETSPMLSRLFVRLFIEDWKTGKYENLTKILERAVGAVKQEVNSTVKHDYNTMSDEEIDRRLAELD